MLLSWGSLFKKVGLLVFIPGLQSLFLGTVPQTYISAWGWPCTHTSFLTKSGWGHNFQALDHISMPKVSPPGNQPCCHLPKYNLGESIYYGISYIGFCKIIHYWSQTKKIGYSGIHPGPFVPCTFIKHRLCATYCLYKEYGRLLMVYWDWHV